MRQSLSIDSPSASEQSARDASLRRHATMSSLLHLPVAGESLPPVRTEGMGEGFFRSQVRQRFQRSMIYAILGLHEHPPRHGK